jgi:hypothetical protein
MQASVPKRRGIPGGLLAPLARACAAGLRLVPAASGHQRFVVEAFIRRRFAEQHAARVTRFMPCLLGLHAADGSLHGAVGLRRAQAGPLFLERYLDLPIEEAIGLRAGEAVGRSEIVEVGNLAADGQGTARRLIVSLADRLAGEGLRWVAFTGTPALINSFRRLGLCPQRLGPADPARLGAELSDWGRYYDCRPQVMVGRIPEGYRQLARQGAYRDAGQPATITQRGPVHAARP